MAELARQVPDDVVIFDEALTDVARADAPPAADAARATTSRRAAARSASASPARSGVKLAHPDKTVIGFSGDGGAMYTIQALWTAAHHDIGAKFVVCNNRSYQLLKLNMQQYWQRARASPTTTFPGSFDLGKPEIRFDELARGMGVAGRARRDRRRGRAGDRRGTRTSPARS